MKIRSLRSQMIIGFSCIVLLTVAVVSLVSNLLIDRRFEAYIAQRQQEFSESLAENIESQYNSELGGWNLDYIHGFGMYALDDGYIIKLLDRDENTLWDAENHDMALCHRIMEGIEQRLQERRPDAAGEPVSVTYELHMDGDTVGYAVIRYYSPYYAGESAFGFLDSLNQILLIVGILSLAAAIVMGIIFAGRIAKPLERTTEITRQIAAGDYKVEFDEPVRASELTQLTESVSSMAKALENQEKLRRKLTSDVAHELRTPLANVSSYIEAMAEGVWEATPERLNDCYAEIQRLTGIIQELEELHQLEDGRLRLRKERTDLLALCRTVISTFGTVMLEKGVECQVSGEETIAAVDRRQMHQAIFNLISNAVKYTDPGDRILVTVRQEDGSAILTVTDHGIGIPQEEQALIFERFYRTDESRCRKSGGTGIGLTIVKSVAEAHGGAVSVVSGHGETTFAIRIPADADGSA